jgi:thiol:disulfide interchange protein
MAFRPQFRLRDATTAEIKFDVVPGYYLYRDRIRVEGVTVEPQVGSRAGKPRQGSAASRATTLLVLTMPAGRYVEDPTFGRVEIYDRSMVVQVDLAPPQTVSKATGATSKSPDVSRMCCCRGLLPASAARIRTSCDRQRLT